MTGKHNFLEVINILAPIAKILDFEIKITNNGFLLRPKKKALILTSLHYVSPKDNRRNS